MKNNNQNLKLPQKHSEQLAEFLGILTGDGYMNFYKKNYQYMINISGDSRNDYEYLTKYVTPLINGLFNISPHMRIHKNQNTMDLYIISKELFFYLESIGFKRGKKEQIGIPEWILSNDNFLFSFNKGLIDTDFSLVLLNRKQKKYKYYPRISIYFKSKVLIQYLEKWLKINQFPLTVSYNQIHKDKRGFTSIGNTLHINGRKNVAKFVDFIGFRNSRHLERYDKYKKMSSLGFEPRI